MRIRQQEFFNIFSLYILYLFFNNIEYIEENGHLWLYKFNYDTSVEDITNKSIDIYNMIK